MAVKRGFLALFGPCALLAALSLASAQEMAPAAHNNDFGGTWWMSAGPPAPRPLILTFNASGTFTLQDSIDGGGHTLSGASFSLSQGTWARGPQRTAEALGLRFVYDASGKTMSVERVRLSVLLLDDLDQMEGTYTIEQMFCSEQWTPLPFTVPVCPDPSVAPTEVLRGPAPFTAVRIRVGAPVG
jgi:hypothetical protein